MSKSEHNESTTELINSIVSGDTLAASEKFGNLLMSRIADAIEDKRVEVAQSMFATESLDEGWKKEDPNSETKTNRDRKGVKVVTPNGEGTINYEYKEPTFSQTSPYSSARISVTHKDGSKKHYDAHEVRVKKG